VLPEQLGLGLPQPVRGGAGVVEPQLLHGREPLHQRPQLRAVAVGQRALQAGQHRPLRRHLGGVRGHVLAHRRAGHLLVVDLPLHRGAPHVGHPHQLQAAAEGGELGQLLERRELLLVGAGHQHQVELQHQAVERDAPGLAGAEQVLEGLQGPLEQVGELDEAAVGRHQRPARLEERHRVERRRQRRRRLVGRDLAVAGVHRELRLHGDGRLLVPGGDVEALHLHVAQHLEPVAPVGAQERVVHLPAVMAELAGAQVVGQDEVRLAGPLRRGRPAEGLQQPAPLGARHQQEGVVLERTGQAGVEGVAVQVGEAAQFGPLGATPAGAEAERASPLQPLVAREDPAEPVEGPLRRAGVGLHRPEEGPDQRRLGRPVGPVEQDDLVDPAGPHEGAEGPDDGRLDLLLARHPLGAAVRVEALVEQGPAAQPPRRRLHRLLAEVLQDVAQVLRRGAGVAPRGLVDGRQVLLEGEDRPVLDEGGAHVATHRPEPPPRVHVASAAPPRAPPGM
jgi:hypothetical protein